MSQASDPYGGLYTIDTCVKPARTPSEFATSDGLHTIDTSVTSHPPWSGVSGRVPTQEKLATVPQEEENKKHSIGGLRPLVFWILIVLIAAVVVAASVGAAVGATQASKKAGTISNANPQNSASSTATTSPASTSGTTSATSSSSSITAATPSPIVRGTRDCPAKNGTIYTPLNPETGKNLDFSFQKICSHSHDTTKYYLASAFVPSMDACIQLCANINYWQAMAGSDVRCKVINYGPGGVMPNNCWVSNITRALNAEDDWDSAMLIE